MVLMKRKCGLIITIIITIISLFYCFMNYLSYIVSIKYYYEPMLLERPENAYNLDLIMIQWKITIINMIIMSVVYFITSLLWYIYTDKKN